MKARTDPFLLRAALLVLALVHAAPAATRVEQTAHNLTATGPGEIRATTGAGPSLCGFCHIPHNAVQTRGLWARNLPTQSYKLYESSTLEATLEQPTGSSRLCLSCHDGTLALGTTRERTEPTLGQLTGRTLLGTDLSDDHPISFRYDDELVARRASLADPQNLRREIRLDETGQIQCTSCHDPHQDRFSNFLVMDPSRGALCVVCHRIPLWEDSSHAISTVAGTPRRALPGGEVTVAENGCGSCHQTHGAVEPVRLLRGATEEDTCLDCHDGSITATNVRAAIAKPSAHRVEAYQGVHDPTENPLTMREHVECVDCHDPHQTRAASAGSMLPGPLTGVSAADVSGGVLAEANFEYEVCLKCHGLREAETPAVFREDDVTNVRLEIDPSNLSFHPIAEAGRNLDDIRGLEPPLNAASLITCTSCHDSDSSGSQTPRGPHGSIYRPILAREYRLDGSPGGESFQTYALCYGCHNRTVLYQESDFAFPHRKHVREVGASCAVCHDAHGSRRNLRLINFMVRDRTGASVVEPASSGALEFQSLGPGSGRCFLTCHGEEHDPEGYGAGAEMEAGPHAEPAPATGALRRMPQLRLPPARR